MYRKNTASQYIYFVLVKAADGTALTGATVTAYRALDNGSQASATGTTTELANGQYRFNLSQEDTNADYGSYLFTASTAVPVEKTVVFTAANPTDSAAFGLSKFGDIETDTQDIQSRLPAALVSGRIDASVGAMQANTVTASALATDAAFEIAQETANVVFSYDVEGIDNFGVLVGQIHAGVLAIEVDTQNIQTRLPTSLVSGRMDSSVGAMAANTITAAALAADAAIEIGDAVVASSVEGYTQDEATLASVVFRLYTMTEEDGVSAFRYTIDAVDRVWDVPYAQHNTAQTFGKLMDILRKSNTVVDGTVSTAVTPTATSFSSNVNYPTGAFKHAVLLFLTGNLAEQNSPILTYVNTNGVITVEEAFTQAPADGDEFIIIPTTHVHAIAAIQSGLATSSGVTAAFAEIKGAGWSSSTDTLEEIRDAVDAIDGGGGGGSITTPIVGIVPVRSQETLLRVYMGETVSQQITVYEADGETPVSLSGVTLEIVFEGYMEDDISVLASNQITVSGTNNNVVTFNYPAAVTDDKGKYFWSLRDANSPYTVYLNGEVHVLRAAVDDP